MVEINRHHRSPKPNTINVLFFFDKNKVSNDFLDGKDFYLSLTDVKSEFKVKSFDNALGNNDIICLRSPIKLSAYYKLPSIFIRKTDLSKCQKDLSEYIKINSYTNINKKEKNSIINLLDIMKNNKISVAKYKTLIVDFYHEPKLYKIDESLILEILSEYGNLKLHSNPIKSYDIFIEEYIKRYEVKHFDYVTKIKEKQKFEREKIENEINLKNKKEQERLEYENKLKEEKERIIENKIKLTQDYNNNENYYKQKIRNVFEREYYEYILLLGDSLNKHINYIFNRPKIKEHFFILNSDNDKYEDIVYTYLKNTSLNSEDIVKKIVKENFTDFNKFNLNIKKCENFHTLNERLIRDMNFIAKENKKYIYPKINQQNYLKTNILLTHDFDNNNNELLTIQNYVYILEELYKHHSTVFIDQFEQINEELINKIDEMFFISSKNNEDLMQFLTEQLKRSFNDFIRKNELHLTISKKIDDDLNIEEIKDKFKNNIDKNILKFMNTNKNKVIERTIEKVGGYMVANNIFFSDYKDIFINARKMNRKLFYYSGVTNSGKTYAAFEELKKCSSGIYLAPLRLLALEGQEEIEKRGLSCSMLTGEDRDIKPDSNFISCTVEMADYSKEYDVAIIDEIQMIKDYQRGSAWLQALVGIKAKKVILVGSPDIEEQVYFLAKYLNEEIKEVKFIRKNELKVVEKEKQNSLQEKGTAIIAFSRAKVFALKEYYEQIGNKVSIIYGALPPDIKRRNAELFKNGQTDILISTDAIAMGLNLPIKKIIFTDNYKYNGYDMEELDTALLKQICGRAGRYGQYEVGEVTAFDNSVLRFIKNNINKNSKFYYNNFDCYITSEIYSKIKEISKIDEPFKILNMFSNYISFGFINTKVTQEQLSIAQFMDNYKDQFENHEIIKIIRSPFFDQDLSMQIVKILVKNIYKSRKENKNIQDLFSIEKFSTEFLGYRNISAELEYKAYDLLSNFVFSFKELNIYEDFVKNEKKILIEVINEYLVSRELNRLHKKFN